MKNNHYFWNTFKLIVLIGIIGFTSCIPQKKLRYLQELEESQYDTTSVSQNEKENSSYKIQSKDELYIMVNSLNPKTYVFFNGGNGQNQNSQSEIALYLNSYIVNDSGYVELPIIGQIFVQNLTLKDASMVIKDSLKKYLTEVTVIVKLSSFKVTLLGEVKRPGKYSAYVSQMNILEALALAGDMTPYGNRERVMLIREEDGKENIYIINLLDKNLLNYDKFNILPNDIIYVESLNAKTWGFETFPYALILSTLTTFIAMTTLILQIKN